jgi:hypothetical protein
VNVHELLRSEHPDIAAIAEHFDGLNGQARIWAVRELSRKEQAALFDAAEGFRPVGLDDLVSPGTPPLTEVIHYGRNSLLTLNLFEKRFCRPSVGDAATQLWGYNEHGARWLTGPGYFVARPHGRGEVLIDYLVLPPAKPDGWPPIKPNSAGGSRFVYHRTQDVLRGVSRHVTIGRDTKDGKPKDIWFVLCRSEG